MVIRNRSLLAHRSLGILLSLCLGLLCGGLRPVQAQSAPQPEARVLHFPKDRALGKVLINKLHYGHPFYMWAGKRGAWDEYEWEEVGEARGDVAIPAGKLVRLEISQPVVVQDLSPLSSLGPDDIHHLMISHTYDPQGATPAGFNPDSIMTPLAGLKGLKVLDLRYTKIGEQGLTVLRNFTALERLCAPEGLTAKGLAIICELKSLKGLYSIQPQPNGARLDALLRLTNLEELMLLGKSIDDASLEPLAAHPSLKLLMIGGGAPITDRGMAALSRIPSLKALDLRGDATITDQGLALLGASPGIEHLFFYSNHQITDDGVAALKTMRSLKSIDLSYARLTNRSAQILSEIKTLESVAVAAKEMDDRALIALARLPRLRCVGLHASWGVVPSQDEITFTERGLAALATVPTIQELSIGGPGINDAALAQISKMTSLNYLSLIPLITASSAGLAQLKTLKALDSLTIFNDSDALTLAGLTRLGTLDRLRFIQAMDIVQDNSGLDLSGMPNLEQLLLDLRDFQSLRDEDLAGLAGLKHLKRLQIGEDNELLSDRGLASLAGLTSLSTRLMIGGGNLTDKGLESLTGMRQLQDLSVRGRIGDAGLGHLAKMKALRALRVNTSALFSPDGMDRIKAELPFLSRCMIGPERVMNAGRSVMPAPGRDALDIKANTIDGKPLQLSKLGKVVMLHFWANWNPQPLDDLAQLKKINAAMTRKFPGRFVLLSLSMDNDETVWRETVKRAGMDWAQARMSRWRYYGYQYGIKTLPAYYLLAPDGKVLLNPQSQWKDIEAVIERALKK